MTPIAGAAPAVFSRLGHASTSSLTAANYDLNLGASKRQRFQTLDTTAV